MIAMVFLVERGLGQFFHTPTPQGVEASRLDDQTEVVFLGTSRTQVNIDPLLFPRKTVNVSEAGMSYSIMDPLLAAILRRVQNIKLLVLEFTAESFAYSYDEIPHRFEKKFAPFGLAPVSGITRGAKNTEMFVGRWFPNIFSFRLSPRQIIADAPLFNPPKYYASGHNPLDRNLNTDQAMISLKVFIAHVEGMRKTKGIQTNLKAFLGILEQARQRGIHVILLRHPTHQLHADETPKEWEEILVQAGDLAKSVAGIEVEQILDLSRHFRGQEQFFADLDHLNAVGAQAYTKDLTQILDMAK